MKSVLASASLLAVIAGSATAAPRVVFTVVADSDTVLPSSNPSAFPDGDFIENNTLYFLPTINNSGTIAISGQARYPSTPPRTPFGRWLWDRDTESFSNIHDELSPLKILEAVGGSTMLSVGINTLDSPVYVDDFGGVTFYSSGNIFSDTPNLAEPESIAQTAVEIEMSGSETNFPDASGRRFAFSVNRRGDSTWATRPAPGSSQDPDIVIRTIDPARTGTSFNFVSSVPPGLSVENRFNSRFFRLSNQGDDFWSTLGFANSTPGTSIQTARVISNTVPVAQSTLQTPVAGSPFLIESLDGFSINASEEAAAIFSDGGNNQPTGSTLDPSGLIIDGVTMVGASTITDSIAVAIADNNDIVTLVNLNDSTHGDRRAVLVRRSGAPGFAVIADEADAEFAGGISKYLMIDKNGYMVFVADRVAYFVDTDNTATPMYDDQSTFTVYEGGAAEIIDGPIPCPNPSGCNNGERMITVSSDSFSYTLTSTNEGLPRWMSHDSLLASIAVQREFSNLTTFRILLADIYPCAPDVNKDGVLDIGDLTLFPMLFNAQDPVADFINDSDTTAGVWDLHDIDFFVTAFQAGCP